MIKSKFALSIIFAFTINSISFASDTKSENPAVAEDSIVIPPAQANETSKETFFRYMSVTPARYLFQMQQWNAINRPADSNFLKFFNFNNEFLAHAYNQTLQIGAKGLSGFLLHAGLNMTKLDEKSSKKYNTLVRHLKELVSNMGAPKKAVDNMSIFLVSGPSNALTVSADQDQIIVVISDQLLEKMNISEIRAVVAHEFGHIISEHMAQRALHTMMINAIAEELTDILETRAQDSTNDDQEMNSKNIVAFDYWDKALQAMSGIGIKANHRQEANANFMQFLAAARELNPDFKHYIFKTYIDNLIVALKAGMATPELINYFQNVVKKALDTGIRHSLSYKKFSQHVEVAMSAISRVAESSADNYATTYLPNEHVASALLKLKGLDFTVDERKKIIENNLEQYMTMMKNVNPHDLARAVQGDDHPPINLRFAITLKAANYPSLLFTSPYLRLLLLEDTLSDGNWPNEKDIDVILESLQKDILKKITDYGLTKNPNPRFDNLIQFYAMNRELHYRIYLASKEHLAKATAENEANEWKFLIQYLEKILSKQSNLIYAVKAEIDLTLEKNNSLTVSEKQLLEYRKNQLLTLLNETNPDRLSELRMSTLSKITANSRRRLNQPPIDSKVLENPNSCMNLLRKVTSRTIEKEQTQKLNEEESQAAPPSN